MERGWHDERALMRKLRAIIIDDEPFIRNMLKDFFLLRGYEVLSYSDATTVCPLFGRDGDVCTNEWPCGDVLITDFNMPGLNGVELLEHQQGKGCKLDRRNKAVISGYIDDMSRRTLDDLGCTFFRKPFTIHAIAAWLADCEQRADLSVPLTSRRREARFESYRELTLRISQTDQVLTGIAVNISQSGLCLKIPAKLRQSDSVHIDECHFLTCTEASVRWVKPLGNDAYIAGLLCLSQEHTVPHGK